ncbi:MAG: hypothetical protein HY823_15255 [Acidobacteria bacterium]|nr:hypothetical protein [Acidobacteriota bacterium]
MFPQPSSHPSCRPGPSRVVFAIALLGCLACGWGVDRARLHRRPVQARAEDGWVRLPLDAEAQRHAGGLWLGDKEGRPVPFLLEGKGLWEPRQLDVEKLLLGGTSEGRLSAEFSLRIPEAWKIRDREQLRIELDLDGRAPWACRVDVQRRLEGGPFLGLPRESPLESHDLGPPETPRRTLVVPWDAQDYRLSLVPILGKAPNLRSLRVWAVTDPLELEPDAMQQPSELQREGVGEPERWRIRLGAPERVVGLDLTLRPGSQPVKPLLSRAGDTPEAALRPVRVDGLVWNLPGPAGKSSHLGLDPQVADRFLLVLPAGARLEGLKVLVRRDALIFPAQARQTYLLHLGGAARPVPPPPGPLPPSRMIYGRDPAHLGAAEPDPQGLPLARTLGGQGRTWLRWGAWSAAAALALVAWWLLGRRQ